MKIFKGFYDIINNKSASRLRNAIENVSNSFNDSKTELVNQ